MMAFCPALSRACVALTLLPASPDARRAAIINAARAILREARACRDDLGSHARALAIAAGARRAATHPSKETHP